MSAPGGTRTSRPAIAAEILPPTDPKELFVFERVGRSRAESIPISRHRLAGLLAAQERISFRDSLRIVDIYCDAHFPFVPDYLGKELAIPSLKFSAVMFVILSLITVGVTLSKFQLGQREFFFGIVATLVLAGLAVLVYVRSLFGEFGDHAD